MTTSPITGEVFGEQQARQRTHDFLVSESQKSLAELQPYFESAREALLSAVEGVSDAQARFQPAGGQGEDAWSIVQVLQHITGAARRCAGRLRAFNLGEELPPMSAVRPQNDATPVQQLIDQLKQSRLDLICALEAVEGREKLDVTGTHPAFGELNARAFFRLQALHEEDHARQIEKTKTHPDYPPA